MRQECWKRHFRGHFKRHSSGRNSPGKMGENMMMASYAEKRLQTLQQEVAGHVLGIEGRSIWPECDEQGSGCDQKAREDGHISQDLVGLTNFLPTTKGDH